MPASSGQSQFSIRSLVALKLKLKNYVCGQSPIDFENILEGTYMYVYLHIVFAKKKFVPALFMNYIINLKH